MTDARYPDRWLSDRRLLRLSDPAHRLFVVALAWSVSNRTDGALTDDDLTLIPRADTGSAAELHAAGLWERDGARWIIADFRATQTTAAQLAGLDRKREIDRERQARHRARSVTRDTTRDTKARPGQARTGTTPATTETEPDRPDPAPHATAPTRATAADDDHAARRWAATAHGYDR